MRRWAWSAGVTLFLLVFVVAVTWPAVPFGIAALTSDSVPAPLGDAWDHPSPGFAARFPPGTSQEALLIWLRANRFTLSAGYAEREIHAFPCLDDARVSWKGDASGNLTAASATLHQTCM
jgi:hypothetical protein